MKIYRYKSRESEGGFALPLILSLSAVVAGLLLTAINSSIGNNANSRIRALASLSNSGLESFVNDYRALLNDATNGNLFSFFWLVQGCSTNNARTPQNCPTSFGGGSTIPASGIQRPDQTFWVDNSFCASGSGQGCLGRQIAPKCDYYNPNDSALGRNIDWAGMANVVNDYHNRLKDVSRSQQIAGRYNQLGNIFTKTTIGQIEQGGRSQLDLVSILKEGNRIQGERRATLSTEIERSAPYSGFAFISAGMSQNDINSINLSNLRTVDPSGVSARGTILLRRNMNGWNRDNYLNPISCGSMSSIFFNAGNFDLPRRGNGGLLAHSTYWPTSSKIPSQPPTSPPPTRVIGSSERISLDVTSTDKKHLYRNLFVLRGATLFIETSDQNRVTLQITDSLDVAPGGRICNVSRGSSVCGSGKAENLTIVSTFRDYSLGYSANADHTGCSVARGGEGTGEVYSDRSPYTSRPGSTFTFRGTGNSSSQEKFSGFIYGEDLAFTSGGNYRGRRGTYMVNNRDNRGSRGSSLVVHRGRISVVNLPGYGNRVWGLVSPRSNVLVINADHVRSRRNRMNPGDTYLEDKKILSVTERTSDGDFQSRFPGSYIPERVYITYDEGSDTIQLHSWRELRRAARADDTHGLIKLELGLPGNITSNVGSVPSIFRASDYWRYNATLRNLYGLTIERPNTQDMNSERVFSGAVWARQVCFSKVWAFGDYLQRQSWIFDPSFVDKLAAYYGQNFRWGFSNYKSRYITSWDILRDFIN